MITRVPPGSYVQFNSCGGRVPGCALKGQPSWPVGSTRNPAQGRATPPSGRSGTLGELPPPPPPRSPALAILPRPCHAEPGEDRRSEGERGIFVWYPYPRVPRRFASLCPGLGSSLSLRANSVALSGRGPYPGTRLNNSTGLLAPTSQQFNGPQDPARLIINN